MMPGMSEEDANLCLFEEEAAEHLMTVRGGEVFAYSSRCPGKARPNEDAAAVLPCGDSLLLVVADGIGGQPGAEQASGITIRALQRAVERASSGGVAVHDLILSALEEANLKILGLGMGAGTTIALAEVCGGAMRSYHAGDSSVMISSASGEVRSLTIAHSPIGYAQAAGLLSEEDALHHPDRNIISNVVGSRQMRVEVSTQVQLQDGDTLLVVSDGVTDNLRLGELVELTRGGALLRAGRAVVEASSDRMGGAGVGQGTPAKPDDLTCLVYRASSEE